MKSGKAWVVFLLVVLAILGVSGWVGFRLVKVRRLQREINERLATLQAAGQPITRKDLARMYPDPPPELDASRLLAKSLALTGSTNGPESLLIDDTWSPGAPTKNFTALDRYITSIQPALAALPKSWPKGSRMPALGAMGITNASNVSATKVYHLLKSILLDASFRVKSGETGRAVSELAICLDISGSLRRTIVMGGLREYGIRRSCVVLERLLSKEALTVAQIDLLSECVANAERDDLSEAIAIYRCLEICRQEARRSSLGQMKSFLWKIMFTTFEPRMMRRQDFLSFLDLMDGYLRLTELPLRQRIKPAAELARKYRESTGSKSAYDPVAWYRLFEAGLDTRTHAQIARAALAVERYRSMNLGRLPTDILDAAHNGTDRDLIFDSCADQPLHYRKTKSGYLIYSVGIDGQDDGGVPSADPKKEKDIIFEVAR
jgi:hypothetical protein